jgi:hypothetical protein
LQFEAALVDTASAIRTALNNHITNDEDTDSTNEYNTGFEVNGTGDSLIITDAGTRFAVAIGDVIDTSNLYAQILLNRDSINLNEQGIIDSTAAVRSALVDTASAIRTALNNHITNDEDTDSTNEYNTGFEVNGTGEQFDYFRCRDSILLRNPICRSYWRCHRHIELVRSNPIES